MAFDFDSENLFESAKYPASAGIAVHVLENLPARLSPRRVPASVRANGWMASKSAEVSKGSAISPRGCACGTFSSFRRDSRAFGGNLQSASSDAKNTSPNVRPPGLWQRHGNTGICRHSGPSLTRPRPKAHQLHPFRRSGTRLKDMSFRPVFLRVCPRCSRERTREVCGVTSREATPQTDRSRGWRKRG